jgi:hypothetical protein
MSRNRDWWRVRHASVGITLNRSATEYLVTQGLRLDKDPERKLELQVTPYMARRIAEQLLEYASRAEAETERIKA